MYEKMDRLVRKALAEPRTGHSLPRRWGKSPWEMELETWLFLEFVYGEENVMSGGAEGVVNESDVIPCPEGRKREITNWKGLR